METIKLEWRGGADQVGLPGVQDIPGPAIQDYHSRRGRQHDSGCAVCAEAYHGEPLADYAVLLDLQLRNPVRHSPPETHTRISPFATSSGLTNSSLLHSIIEPITSRCSKFRFKPLDVGSTEGRLREICLKEEVDCPDEVTTTHPLTPPSTQSPRITADQNSFVNPGFVSADQDC